MILVVSTTYLILKWVNYLQRPDRQCDFDDLNPKKMDKDKFVELREKILQQGSTYASENWNVHEKPNEHDNAHDDFIAGALWLIKNHSDLSHVIGTTCIYCSDLGIIEDHQGNRSTCPCHY